MASAEEYASWIVANKDKQGTPEFETVARAYQIARGQPASKPTPANDPSEGGGTLHFGPLDTGIKTGQGVERFLAGTGKAFYDVGRGVSQIFGGTSDADVADSRRLDAPLMATGAGKFGNIVGNVGIAAPTMFIPGANTLTGAAITGALTGAVQPVTGDESRMGNAAFGAVTAPAAVLAGRGVAAVASGAKSLVDPFTKNGQQAIAARVLQHFAGRDANAVAAELASAPGPGLAGYTMTAAQAVDNAGLAQLERTLRNNPSLANDWKMLDNQNRSAILDAIRGIARTPAELDAATAARSATANTLYGAARKEGSGVAAKLDDLLERPAIKSAIADAQTTAANFGEKLDDTNPVSLLHWAKMNLDGRISAASQAGNKTEAAALQNARDALLTRIEEISPTYRQGREAFSQMSGPINRMEVGQTLLNKIEPALSQLSDIGTDGLTPATFARAVQNSQGVVRNATGRTGELADVLTPDEMGQVNGVLNALARRQRALDAGRAVGSNTGQNMVAQNILRSFAGPTGLPQSWTDAMVGNALTQSLSRGVTTVARPAEEGVLRALFEAAQDPAVANSLLRRAEQVAPSTRILRAVERTRALPLAAIGLTNSSE